MAHPSAILFDVDGTLVDTYRLYVEAYQRALEPYLGHVPSVEEIAARRPSSERAFLAGWIGEENADACHAEMRRHYAALHPTLHDGVYEGVREMLAAVRAAGFRLGIVTGKGIDGWRLVEGHLGPGAWDAVVTDDDGHPPKPDPAALLAAARTMGINPMDVVYVGDSAGDLRAARAAGMRAAAALWAKTAPGEADSFLRSVPDAPPEWAFRRPADLTRALAPWC